jgi:hypothetical protein
MLLVAAAALGLGWLARVEGRARSRRRAFAFASRLGGSTWTRAEKPIFFGEAESFNETPLWGWVRRHVGWEYADDVVGISLDAGESPPRVIDLAELIEQPDLEWLQILGFSLSDESMAQVGRMPRLESLVISQGEVTDLGLRKLAGLRRLRTLVIGGCPITDAGIIALGPMESVERVVLHCPRIGDRGLAGLARWPRVEILHLQFTGVTDAGLEPLVSMPALKEVDLRETRVTPDAGLRLERAFGRLGRNVQVHPIPGETAR